MDILALLLSADGEEGAIAAANALANAGEGLPRAVLFEVEPAPFGEPESPEIWNEISTRAHEAFVEEEASLKARLGRSWTISSLATPAGFIGERAGEAARYAELAVVGAPLTGLKLGLSLTEKAAARCYAPERRAEIYRDLAAQAAQAMKARASTIADATFGVQSTREAIAAAAGSARFRAYWLSAALGVRLARVARRTGDASDADIKVASAQTEPADLCSLWHRLDANRAVSAIVQDIVDDIALK